jgi:formylglycine-generating enzyme required for sulfatase activity
MVLILVAFANAQNNNSREAERHYRVALVALKNNDFDIAEIELKKAAELAPTNAILFYYLAIVEQKHSLLDQALKDVNKALSFGLPKDETAQAEDLLAELTYAVRKQLVIPTPVALAADAIKVNPKDNLKYVWIPAGTFTMGCSNGDTECKADENPPHPVTITHGFWLGQTAVTQQAYERVMGSNSKGWPNEFKGPNLPVEEVNWDEAQAYCRTIGGRLPTEAEWEYAARAGTTGVRYGELDQIAWHEEYAFYTKTPTHEVAQKFPNAFGLYDMLGNVDQWTADWWADYISGAQTDPLGPSEAPQGHNRTHRGGSGDNPRVSERGGDGPGVHYKYIGFRCVGK